MFPFLGGLGNMEMENPYWMSIYGLGRGIILSIPFFFFHFYQVAACIIVAFTLQGLAYHLGKKMESIYRPAIFMDEFTEWGEVLTGAFIGLALIIGIMT